MWPLIVIRFTKMWQLKVSRDDFSQNANKNRISALASKKGQIKKRRIRTYYYINYLKGIKKNAFNIVPLIFYLTHFRGQVKNP